MTEVGEVREALARTTEGVCLLQRVGRQPYHDLPDVLALLPTARVEGTYLEPRELSDIASFIEGGTEIASRVARVEGVPRPLPVRSGAPSCLPASWPTTRRRSWPRRGARSSD
jgi:dsDNA-specific endonuclease/ATPase MutS2